MLEGGVPMRVLLATGILLAGAVMGYSASGVSAQTESTASVVSVGDVIEVQYPSEVTGVILRCTVTGLRDAYVRCKDTETTAVSRPKPEVWYNLRIAYMVLKPTRDAFSVR
jgi:hypothetical protein